MTQQQIRLFGAPWCPDCRRSKQFLNEQRVAFEWNDIDQDEAARAYVQEVNNGKQIIPTIVFSNGSILVEPTNAELADKLEITRLATRAYYELIIIGGGPAAPRGRHLHSQGRAEHADNRARRNRRPGWNYPGD